MKAQTTTMPWSEVRPRRGSNGGSRGRPRQRDRNAGSRKTLKARQSTRERAKSRTRAAYLVLVPALLLLLLGLVMVLSSGSVIGLQQHHSSYYYFIQQFIWALLGISALLIICRVDYHRLGRLAFVALIISVGMLVAVLVPAVGRSAGGSTRWLVMGPISLQPTELVKFSLIIFGAYALATKKEKLRNIKHLLFPVVAITALVMVLLLLQPDLGSAIVIAAAVFVLLFVSRSKAGHVVLIGSLGVVSSLALSLSEPYRRARVFSFLNPWASPRGSGYQVIQSYIALGSGSVTGVGLGMGRQKFWYLPNSHTDFIFAVIGEELGILGSLFVVCMIALLVYGGFRVARRAPDELGRLLAIGIVSLIGIQALVNMGGVTGLMPITGVPLPLVSFGGSSLCVVLVGIGILLNIAKQGNKKARGGTRAASCPDRRRNRRTRIS